MRYLYINSRLHPLSLAVADRTPREWLFSRGEPWLLLTPPRLGSLARRLGLRDGRVSRLLELVHRWHPHPERFCRALGVEERVQLSPNEYPLAVCPYCERLHYPHPADAFRPCPKCVEEEARTSGIHPGLVEERRRNQERRQWLLKNDPNAFDDSVLSPHWRINKKRRLERDWFNAVNRILTGAPYRAVAREFSCSVGLLHRKVKARKHWHDN